MQPCKVADVIVSIVMCVSDKELSTRAIAPDPSHCFTEYYMAFKRNSCVANVTRFSDLVECWYERNLEQYLREKGVIDMTADSYLMTYTPFIWPLLGGALQVSKARKRTFQRVYRRKPEQVDPVR
jgi:hypothetical protein